MKCRREEKEKPNDKLNESTRFRTKWLKSKDSRLRFHVSSFEILPAKKIIRTYAYDSGGESRHRTDARSPREFGITAIEPYFWLNSATTDDRADRWHRYSTRIEKSSHSQNCAFISLKLILLCFCVSIFGEYQALLLQKYISIIRRISTIILFSSIFCSQRQLKTTLY